MAAHQSVISCVIQMHGWHEGAALPTVLYLGQAGEFVDFPAPGPDARSGPGEGATPASRQWLGALAGWRGKKPDQSRVRSRFISNLIEHALAHGIRAFILDLNEVRFLNSQGISEIVKWSISIRKREGSLVIANANERTRWIFQTTQLEKVFPLYDSLAEAHEELLQQSRADVRPDAESNPDPGELS